MICASHFALLLLICWLRRLPPTPFGLRRHSEASNTAPKEVNLSQDGYKMAQDRFKVSTLRAQACPG